MTWSYRVILHDTDPNRERWWYGLHEVYYNAVGDVTAWTEEPVGFTCSSDEGIEGVQQSLDMASADARRPLLRESELPTG